MSTDTNAVEQIPRRACLLGEQDGQQTLGAARTTILTAFGAPGRSTCEVSASEWDRCSAGSGDLSGATFVPKKRKDSALRASKSDRGTSRVYIAHVLTIGK